VKKGGVLNQAVSEVIAGMGHMDMLVIGDAGLPTPSGVRRIDLAVREGVPGFVETVETVATELQAERIIVAEETKGTSPRIQAAISDIFDGVPMETVSHEELKELSKRAVAVIRTGEFTPYANVVMVSGVLF